MQIQIGDETYCLLDQWGLTPHGDRNQTGWACHGIAVTESGEVSLPTQLIPRC